MTVEQPGTPHQPAHTGHQPCMPQPAQRLNYPYAVTCRKDRNPAE